MIAWRLFLILFLAAASALAGYAAGYSNGKDSTRREREALGARVQELEWCVVVQGFHLNLRNRGVLQ